MAKDRYSGFSHSCVIISLLSLKNRLWPIDPLLYRYEIILMEVHRHKVEKTV